jgi:hypothetical protein
VEEAAGKKAKPHNDPNNNHKRRLEAMAQGEEGEEEALPEENAVNLQPSRDHHLPGPKSSELTKHIFSPFSFQTFSGISIFVQLIN